MSTYNSYPSYPRRFPSRFAGSYGAPSTIMTQPYYTSYTPSAATYNSYSSGAYQTGANSERTYFSFNGKLIRSYKIRSYRVTSFWGHRSTNLVGHHLIVFFFFFQRAQKHALELYPDTLMGIASSRIQFYVIRPGYSRGRYVGLKSYISKNAWPTEIETLAEHETIGIEVRPSISFTESLVSFFSRSRVM